MMLHSGAWPKSSFVASLTERERDALFESSREVAFGHGDILMLQGAVGDRVFVIVDGFVKVAAATETGIETMLTVRTRGDLVGEFAVLDGNPRTATVSAVGAVVALRIGRDQFLTYGERYPKAQGKITRALLSKIRLSTERRVTAQGWDARARLARLLYELVLEHGEPLSDGSMLVRLALTQFELGALASVAESTTERILADFRRRGILSTHYRKIVVRDIAALEDARHSTQKP
jgi:CRP/FNR family transcriptional regulator, cyclic AMP receptor protein